MTEAAKSRFSSPYLAWLETSASALSNQVLREVVDCVLGNVVTGQDDRADRNRGHIAVGAVNIGGDDVLGIVVRRCAEAFDVLVVKGNEVDVLGGGEVSDGGRGAPATMKAASILPSLISLALSPKDW